MTDVEARQEWARRYIRLAPDAPAYGTPEWLALPDGPAKVAAVVRAAECWQTDLEATLARLQAEHEAVLLAAKLAEDAEFVQRRERHRRSWTGRGFRRDQAVEADVEREWREWVSA